MFYIKLLGTGHARVPFYGFAALLGNDCDHWKCDSTSAIVGDHQRQSAIVTVIWAQKVLFSASMFIISMMHLHPPLQQNSVCL